jgi:hypothetical protein
MTHKGLQIRRSATCKASLTNAVSTVCCQLLGFEVCCHFLRCRTSSLACFSLPTDVPCQLCNPAQVAIAHIRCVGWWACWLQWELLHLMRYDHMCS